MGKYRIAMYVRLSKEDVGRDAESYSISMQRMLLMGYIEKKFMDCELMEFVDDGYTGTNLNRPGLQKLLNLVKESKVDCIIVKDFSRFARDYIEVGSYLEQIFPFFKVRFISVNDNYDSQESKGSIPGLDVNFKNLLYDLYSKDLSQKVRTALAARKAAGAYISANAPFGYEKAPNDRHMLVIEKDEAKIIKKIYKLTMKGLTSTQIAKLFNIGGVKTPIEFKIEKGKTSRLPKGEQFLWSKGVICQILRNPVYVGDIEYGKYTKEVGGKNHLKPRKEWSIYHNHHEPIISRDVFELIQEGRGKERNPQHNPPYALTGKAVCACCGKNLSFRRRLNPYFYCSERYSNGLQGCVENVNAMYLEQVILFHMQERITNNQEERKRHENRIAKIKEEIKELEHEQCLLLTKIANEKKRKSKEYEDYALGKTRAFQSEDRNIKLLERKLADLEDRKMLLEDNICKAVNNPSAAWNDDLYAALSEEMVSCYIERVVIKNEQDIQIEWRSDTKGII